ncbi:response regulator [Ramlibacter pallidus]|uniref:Response regulator transcription factor n=1 Tax=Ramlibacter pallidus TaxID=2780087 RepID=A0ABR9S2S0_9BURK|nr:response regulator transcription factor [Ramlibacter pallidus]MBE7367739.1 response regulator transcription factor [Ramlibacter pallidus]
MHIESPGPRRPLALRVGVVEDDAATRESMLAMINAQADMAVVLCAAGQQEALALLRQCPLDVLLVDLGLPDGSGLDVIRSARALWSGCSVMVSTMFGDEAHVLRSIEAGAMGYLLKDSGPAELAAEIRNLHAGGSPISPNVARKILARAAASLPAPGAAAPAGDASAAPKPPIETGGLSAREREVLQFVSKGFTTEETADAMGVSRSTVLTFVRRIYAKLQVNSRAEAVHAAHRHGLLAN